MFYSGTGREQKKKIEGFYILSTWFETLDS